MDDIIESERVANREKDLWALPNLESLRDERDSSTPVDSRSPVS